jgi:hypothetical protein
MTSQISAFREDKITVIVVPNGDIDVAQGRSGNQYRVISVRVGFTRGRVFDTERDLWQELDTTSYDENGWSVRVNVSGRRVLKSGAVSDKQVHDLWEVRWAKPEWLTDLVSWASGERDRIVASWPEPGPFHTVQ